MPGTILVGLLCALAYRRYVRTAGRAWLYVALVVVASLLGPFLGWHALIAIFRLQP